jgi:transcriptional regulator with XRE-family HTH domain
VLFIERFQSRLAKALKYKNVSGSELAKHIGVDRSTISYWKNGRTTARQDKVFAVAKFLDLSPAWLMGADVPMLTFNEAIKSNKHSIEQAENVFNDKFAKLSEDNKKQVLGFMDGLLYMQNF